MRIVKGRGNNREVLFNLPCAAVVKQAPEETQRRAVTALCNLIGIPVDGAVAA